MEKNVNMHNQITGSIQRCECDRRLNGLFIESNQWLINSANKITRNKEESEDLVQELYIYLHEKCNPKLFWGPHSYNLFYCSKFLHSRFINKTKRLNRTILVEEVLDSREDIPYDTEKDLEIQEAHDMVMRELNRLKVTRMWPQAKIFELYWMSSDTLDEVAKKIKISKSTTFLAVRKIRQYLKEVIPNPYEQNEE